MKWIRAAKKVLALSNLKMFSLLMLCFAALGTLIGLSPVGILLMIHYGMPLCTWISLLGALAVESILIVWIVI